jgi:hypothetical protein
VTLRHLAVALLAGAVLALGLAGCGGGKNFSPEDFKKVGKGMTEAQVKEVLGSPFDSAEAVGVKRLWWRVGDNYYSASFKDGKVEAAEGPSGREEYELMKGLMKMVK